MTAQDAICRPVFIEDVHANATGYERIVEQMWAKMTRPVYSFRPNLKIQNTRGHGEKFQSVPEGQKSQYLVQAILEKEDRKWLEEVIQKTIKESVRN